MGKKITKILDPENYRKKGKDSNEEEEEEDEINLLWRKNLEKQVEEDA